MGRDRTPRTKITSHSSFGDVGRGTSVIFDFLQAGVMGEKGLAAQIRPFLPSDGPGHLPARKIGSSKRAIVVRQLFSVSARKLMEECSRACPGLDRAC